MITESTGETIDHAKMDLFFNPKSLAVVAASRHLNKAGNVIFANFAENKRRGIFKGEIYPVNPNEDSVLGHRCYPLLKKIPYDVDAVVIVVPGKFVPEVMRDAADKGVSAAVIISAGFSEVGNNQLEDQVNQIAKDAGMRVLGPNCLGVFDSYTGFDMLFLPETKVLSTGQSCAAKADIPGFTMRLSAGRTRGRPQGRPFFFSLAGGIFSRA